MDEREREPTDLLETSDGVDGSDVAVASIGCADAVDDARVERLERCGRRVAGQRPLVLRCHRMDKMDTKVDKW